MTPVDTDCWNFLAKNRKLGKGNLLIQEMETYKKKNYGSVFAYSISGWGEIYGRWWKIYHCGPKPLKG
ncbi:MAG: hypothetical protein DF168_00650 [Candidatus Moanabacter tarae]|uniref:Uncharacterized protein n=1 Tax=Candidatus Moanibacter tarae TaxID=2200854 RepID=A0A2Z4AL04_9BACT|nr:MAG: hypothetical protein DF168_00650 [Candidatus Moanabacter tarae]|tara:strand:- start:6423 stop:6626 length:204 start_codon:yes stop_codon:yes gene_type:complete